MAVIVDIDHEAGDLTEYTSTVTDSGDLSAAAAAALAGTGYGLQVVIDDTTAIYGTKTVTTNTSGVIRVRFYIDPNTLTMTSGTNHWITRVYSAAPGLINVVYLYKSGTNYQLDMVAYNDADGVVGSTATTITDAPHYIEFYTKRATTNISADGVFTWWIDGTQITTTTNIDNYDRFSSFGRIEIGAVIGIDATTSGTFFIDQLVANDDGAEIGAYSTGIKIPVLLAQYRQRRQ